MNIVYYIVSSLIKDKNIGVAGGHGYSYNPETESRRKLMKDAPTVYGYYVNGNYQNIAVDQVDIYNGRVINQPNECMAFILGFRDIANEWLANKKDGEKLLIVSNSIKGQRALVSGSSADTKDNQALVDEIHNLYEDNKGDIIIDLEYHAKGGEGPKVALKQCELAEALCELKDAEEHVLDKMDVKEYKNPEIDFNKLVTASRWYFNTGDKSEHYDLNEFGYRKYTFGRVEPDKNYYGKATPDVYYSTLYTKEPITVLDKLYNFCKANKPNPYNIMMAGNLNFIKSKEVARIIDTYPGKFVKKDLVAPMTLGNTEDAVLVEFIDPPGLSYRIRDFHNKLDMIYGFFKKRDADGNYQKNRFIDITESFFTKDTKGKFKIQPDFTNNTLKLPIMIEAPGCVKPVKINLSIKYDTPERNAFASLVNNKIEDIKVYIALDFNDEAGVSYCTIVETPDFDYIHSNSISNLRVYNLKELGK